MQCLQKVSEGGRPAGLRRQWKEAAGYVVLNQTLDSDLQE